MTIIRSASAYGSRNHGGGTRTLATSNFPSTVDPLTVFIDYFTRADPNSLGPDYLVVPYPGHSASFATDGDEALLAALSSQGFNTAALYNTGVTEGFAEAVISVRDNDFGLIAASTATPFGTGAAGYNVFCSLDFNNNGTMTMRHHFNGGTSGSNVSVSGFGNGDRVRLEVRGATAKLYRNGVHVGTRALAAAPPAAATYYGLHAAWTGPGRWDEFSTGTLAPITYSAEQPDVSYTATGITITEEFSQAESTAQDAPVLQTTVTEAFVSIDLLAAQLDEGSKILTEGQLWPRGNDKLRYLP